MNRNSGWGTALGIAMTIALGATAYSMMNSRSMRSQRKAIRRTADKAAGVINDVVDNISNMVR